MFYISTIFRKEDVENEAIQTAPALFWFTLMYQHK